MLGYRRYSRISRSEANLRVARDRANLYLQTMSHQQQMQITVHNHVGSSVPVPAPSLPPGPPSSSATDLSVAEQQDVLRSGPAHYPPHYWSPHHWAAPKQVEIRVHNHANSSVPASLPADPMPFAKVPAPSLPPGSTSSYSTDLSVAEQQDVLRSSPAHSWSAHYWAAPKREPKFPLSAPLPGATVGIKKRQRQRASAAAPPAKKAYTSPFHEFCLEQRPLLPPGGSRQERERRLGVSSRPF